MTTTRRRASQESIGLPLETEANPIPVRPPIIFEPPFPLVREPEVWIITTGPRREWGGAIAVWSEEADGDRPEALDGMVASDAVTGTLRTPLAPTHVGAPVVVFLALDDEGEVAPVSTEAAHRWQSLAYVGDGRNDYELIAYTGMELDGIEGLAHLYTMHGPLLRGLYGTHVRAHAPGSRFAVLDRAMLRFPLEARFIINRCRLYFRLLGATGPDWEAADELSLAPLIPYDVIDGFNRGARSHR